MINKQNLWFLTLFSLILVLSVYYITMPNDLLLNTANKKNNNSNNTNNEVVNLDVEPSEILVALRVELDEERLNLKTDLESILTNSNVTVEEKNEAYEKLKYLNGIISEEERLEQKIKTSKSIETFIEIDGNEITVVAISKSHDTKLANEIMRLIQDDYKDKMYITVKFK